MYQRCGFPGTVVLLPVDVDQLSCCITYHALYRQPLVHVGKFPRSLISISNEHNPVLYSKQRQ